MARQADLPFIPVSTHSNDATISAATDLTTSVPNDSAGNPATLLLLQCTGQNIRYTLDGTTPTASIGFQMTAGDPPEVIVLDDGSGNSTAVTVTVIEETATATVQYQFGTHRIPESAKL